MQEARESAVPVGLRVRHAFTQWKQGQHSRCISFQINSDNSPFESARYSSIATLFLFKNRSADRTFFFSRRSNPCDFGNF